MSRLSGDQGGSILDGVISGYNGRSLVFFCNVTLQVDHRGIASTTRVGKPNPDAAILDEDCTGAVPVSSIGYLNRYCVTGNG